MSTERKPGSRGVRDPFARAQADPASRHVAAPEPRDKQSVKGSTKTVSPRKSFKKKPRK